MLVTRGKGFDSNIWKQISCNIPAAFEAKCIVRVEGGREKWNLREWVTLIQSSKSPTFSLSQLSDLHSESIPHWWIPHNWLLQVTIESISHLNYYIFQIFISAHLMAQMFLYLMSSTSIFRSQTFFHRRGQRWNAKLSPMVRAIASMHCITLKWQRPTYFSNCGI